MNVFSKIIKWIYSKVLMVLLLIAILTLINFVWYGITPLWVFLTRSEEQYENKKGDLEAQIAQVHAERTTIELEIKNRSANRPSKLKFWKLEAYDAETLSMTQYANRLQAKEQGLKTKLLGLEKPSFKKYLNMFWLSLQENLSVIWGIVLLVVFVPDVWFYLRKKGKLTRFFSTEPLELHDSFWFFHGRIERTKYVIFSGGVLCVLLVLSLASQYIKDVESTVLMVMLSLLQLVGMALVIFEITATVKRFHDIDSSGKQAWLLFIPGYNLYLLTLLLLKKGSGERNKYGHNPSQYKGIF